MNWYLSLFFVVACTLVSLLMIGLIITGGFDIIVFIALGLNILAVYLNYPGIKKRRKE